MSDGLVVIEAESIPLNDPWFFGKDQGIFAGYTGKGFIRTGAVNNNTAGTLRVKIRVKNPGKYRLLLRTNKIAANPKKLNSCYTHFLGLDGPEGEPVVTFQNDPRYAWTFTTQHVLPTSNNSFAFFKFPRPGVYTLEIGAIAESFQIDRIVLYDPILVSFVYAKLLSLQESAKVEPPVPTPAPVIPPTKKPTSAPVPVPIPSAPPTSAPTASTYLSNCCDLESIGFIILSSLISLATCHSTKPKLTQLAWYSFQKQKSCLPLFVHVENGILFAGI